MRQFLYHNVSLPLGGRIDHAHHNNRVYHVLTETLAMQNAVEKALQKTSEEDTLIIVTADHSHAFSFAGYADLADDFLGMCMTTNCYLFR